MATASSVTNTYNYEKDSNRMYYGSMRLIGKCTTRNNSCRYTALHRV